jgi:hypothetical protein
MGLHIKVLAVATAIVISLATSVLAAPQVNPAAAANGGAAAIGGGRVRFVQGRVVAVRPVNGGGVLQVRTNGGWNNAARMNAAGGALGLQTFAVGPATQFQVSQGALWQPTSAAMLRPGQRVIVQAQGQQAVGVRIVMGNNYAGRGRIGYYAVPRVRGVTPNHAPAVRPPSTTPSARVASHHHVSVSHGAGRAGKR